MRNEHNEIEKEIELFEKQMKIANKQKIKYAIGIGILNQNTKTQEVYE